jgi:hypothetical protein
MPVGAATTSATASATILEPVIVPSVWASASETARDERNRVRQVNVRQTDSNERAHDFRTWPVLIEFE